MTPPILLAYPEMLRISPCFLLSHGKPRMGHQRHYLRIRNGLIWGDAPVSYWPYKIIYNRFIR